MNDNKTDGKTDQVVEIAGLIAPAEAEVVVDPVALDHLASDTSLSPGLSPAGGSADEALILTLEDLLPDAEGTVVMLTDDRLPVNLVTEEPLAGSGVVDEQVTAGGLDVEGLYYYSFANGLTLYSDSDIVIVNAASGA